MSEHVTPLRTYMNVFLALMLLTGLTTAVSFLVNTNLLPASSGFDEVLALVFFVPVQQVRRNRGGS